MFVQVVRGQVSDRDEMDRMGQRWADEVRPGAIGFLGSTGGVSADGKLVVIARFESAEAAQANSERPEQSAWWSEAEKLFTSPPTFAESSDVEELFGGGSDDAGFVQIMAGTADRAKVNQLDELFEEHGPSMRPDVLGMLRVWTAPDTYVEVVYFTSEAAARAGEQQELPAEMQAQMGDFEDMMGDIEYIDLTEPQLTPGS